MSRSDRWPQATPMPRLSQQPENVDRYKRALRTMTAVLQALRAQPDPDGTIADLAFRIEADREWVRAAFALGEEPRRPLGWLRRAPGRAA